MKKPFIPRTPEMTKNKPSSAKDQVLAWVRSKNPQTMELKFGCRVLVYQNGYYFAEENDKEEKAKQLGVCEAKMETYSINPSSLLWIP